MPLSSNEQLPALSLGVFCALRKCRKIQNALTGTRILLFNIRVVNHYKTDFKLFYDYETLEYLYSAYIS